MPYIGQGLTEGRRRVETFIATANQTTFNIIYDAGYVDVYQNGILLAEADYTATNGSQVVLAVGAALNDEITIIAHQLFSVTDTVSAAQGGTFTGAVTASGGVVGNVTGTVSNISNHLLDEDNMASNDATKVPSQQSVKAYVDTEVSGLVDSAPSTLDTLNELAAALGDDANFSTTITNSIATKLPLAGGTLTGNLTMENTDAGSAAGPEFVLFRNSASAADADYLGQIKFDGKNDAGQSIVYAKITGKILDASDGTEDGIIEIAHKKAGSNNISARFRSDSLQLINGTNLTVAGTTDLTGDLTVDTNTLHVDTSNNRVGVGTTSPERPLHVRGSNAFIRIESTSASQNSQLDIKSTTATWSIGQNQVLASTGTLEFYNGSSSPVVIKTDGNFGIGTTNPVDRLHIYGNEGNSTMGIVLQDDGWGAPNGQYKLTVRNSDGAFAIRKNTSSNFDFATSEDHLVLTSSSGKGKLGINRDTNLDSTVTIEQATDGTDGGIRIYGSNSNSIRGQMYYDGTQSFVIHGTSGPSGEYSTLRFATGLYNNPQIRMSINKDNGFVGIGTTTPSSGLEISGSGNTSRIKLINGSDQLNLGLWDGSNYRMEGDANRPLFITSYHSNGVALGQSGSTNMQVSTGGVEFLPNSAGSFNFKSGGNPQLSIKTGQFTGASGTTISTSNIQIVNSAFGALVFVAAYGTSGSTAQFCDLVYFGYNASPTIIAQQTIVGSPPTRYYTGSGYALYLRYSSGNYITKVNYIQSHS